MGLQCCSVARGVELSHDYDYIDRRFFLRRKKTLEQGALHNTNVGDLRRYTTKDLNLSPQRPSAPCPDVANCCKISNASPTWTSDSHSSTEPSMAQRVIEQAKKMLLTINHLDCDILHSQWEGPDGVDPLAYLLEEEQLELQAREIAGLAKRAREKLAADPIVVAATVPTRVYGDIHGQFHDLLLLLSDFGFTDAGVSCVFNGDWVDRGAHQLEVIVLIFALKVAFPAQVVLLRGNHEDAEMNVHMGVNGFYFHCTSRFGRKLGKRVFDTVAGVFEWLPMACLIERRVLVLHGGIGAGDWSLEQLGRVDRPLNHEALAKDAMLWNILWSDPIPDEAENSFGVHASPRDNHRNLMKTFGRDVTEAFCEENGLDMVIRSHQALKDGCGYEVMHGGKCLRVFSARDYEGHKNDGSILLITQIRSGKLLIRPQVLRSCRKAAARQGEGGERYEEWSK